MVNKYTKNALCISTYPYLGKRDLHKKVIEQLRTYRSFSVTRVKDLKCRIKTKTLGNVRRILDKKVGIFL